jgi:DNA-binding GntR family transcriptional regulator
MTERSNKSDQAYEALESMITFQELAPGSLLSEAILMERTGLGRTPVREALLRLAHQGMVEVHPNRGVRVAEISVESQLQLLEVRRTLEGLAVRLATSRATPGQRETMIEVAGVLERFEGDDIRAFAPLLKRSHGLVAAAAHNSYLLLAMGPLQGLSRRFWFAHLRDVAAELRRGADRHCAILRAVLSEDADAAAAASLQLNDYLTEFAYGVLRDRFPAGDLIRARRPTSPPAAGE